MSNYTPPPVPVREDSAVKSVFDLNSHLMNSIPEVEAVPFQYGEIKPSSPATAAAPVQSKPQGPPTLLPFPVNDSTPASTQTEEEMYYYTPPQYGYRKNSIKAPPVQKKTSTGKIVAIILGGLVAFWILTILMIGALSFGPTGIIISTMLACIPFAAIFLCLRWVGKWDSEPFALQAGAFLWGAAASIALTLLISQLSEMIFGAPTSVLIGAAVQAPLVEEFSKGLGIVLIALFFRKHFNTPVDGVVYMSLIAAGFAFTENILYFATAYSQMGLEGITQTFILRAVMSPFAHVIFSLPMGIFLGMGRARRRKFLACLGLAIAGYPIAVFFHALWNASASVITDSTQWFVFYGVIQMPIFVTAILIAVWLRRSEARTTYKRLTEYAWAGWFTPAEVDAFATWEGRRQTIAWAKRTSPEAGRVMRTIAKDVVDLAYLREYIVRTKATDDVIDTEKQLLAKIDFNKNYLLGL